MQITRTVRVVTRHSRDCEYRKEVLDKKSGKMIGGPEWRRCNCRKSLVVYNGVTKKTERISAKTRSFEKAQKFAQDYLDSFDPDKQELKRLRAVKGKEQVRIERAVELYLQDMIARLGDNGTVEGARYLLEDSLCGWIAAQAPRPVMVSEIKPEYLIAWRSSWIVGDLTASIRWSGVKSFLNFCESQRWISDSPARRIRAPKVARGGRTAIFSDDQYAAILKAIKDPCTLAFVELCRWGGMALSDAVQWRPEMVDPEGVLRYRRHKTGELAVVPLPKHVVELLHNVGPGQPFRDKNNILKSDVRSWQYELGRVFKLAGITEVRTESDNTRPPHAHMLRDTCAVSALRHGASLHTVARMLGHSKTTTTEKSYLPFCKELETAAIADARAAQAAATVKRA